MYERRDKWRITFILTFFSTYHTRFTLFIWPSFLSLNKERSVFLALYPYHAVAQRYKLEGRMKGKKEGREEFYVLCDKHI